MPSPCSQKPAQRMESESLRLCMILRGGVTVFNINSSDAATLLSFIIHVSIERVMATGKKSGFFHNFSPKCFMRCGNHRRIFAMLPFCLLVAYFPLDDITSKLYTEDSKAFEHEAFYSFVRVQSWQKLGSQNPKIEQRFLLHYDTTELKMPVVSQ